MNNPIRSALALGLVQAFFFSALCACAEPVDPAIDPETTGEPGESESTGDGDGDGDGDGQAEGASGGWSTCSDVWEDCSNDAGAWEVDCLSEAEDLHPAESCELGDALAFCSGVASTMRKDCAEDYGACAGEDTAPDGASADRHFCRSVAWVSAGECWADCSGTGPQFDACAFALDEDLETCVLW